MLLLQLLTVELAQNSVIPKKTLSIFDLMLKGGVVMIPIGLLLFISFYLIIERYLYIRKASAVRPSEWMMIKNSLHQGDLRVAEDLCRNSLSTTMNIFQTAVRKIGAPVQEIEAAISSRSNIEINKMSKNLNILGIIAGVAPMLGFIGTISGIIKIFYDISLTENISISIIASGLYEKMVTSGSGLIVGIIAYTGYHILQNMIENFAANIESESFEFITLLEESVV